MALLQFVIAFYFKSLSTTTLYTLSYSKKRGSTFTRDSALLPCLPKPATS
jgi:hypothetical protein